MSKSKRKQPSRASRDLLKVAKKANERAEAMAYKKKGGKS